MSLFQTTSFIVFVPGVSSVEFVILCVETVLCEAKQRRTAGMNAVAASRTDGCLVSFILLSSPPHTHRSKLNPWCFSLCLHGCLPPCLMQWLLLSLHVCISLFLSFNTHKHAEAHSDMCIFTQAQFARISRTCTLLNFTLSLSRLPCQQPDFSDLEKTDETPLHVSVAGDPTVVWRVCFGGDPALHGRLHHTERLSGNHW